MAEMSLEQAARAYRRAYEERLAAIETHEAALKAWRAGPRTPDTDAPVEQAEQVRHRAMYDCTTAEVALLAAARDIPYS